MDDAARTLDAWWRAANYLSVGQIYLLDNPLLARTSRREHVKRRLLGHSGTITRADLPLRGPEPFIVERGSRRALRCRTGARRTRSCGRQGVAGGHVLGRSPGGSRVTGRACAACSASSPSPVASRRHVAPETPGSIHEGGELGYLLVPRLWSRVRQPRSDRWRASSATAKRRPVPGRLVASNKLLNPACDGAVLPLLHLNGYKIAGPTVRPASPNPSCASCRAATATNPGSWEGIQPRRDARRLWRSALDEVFDEIATIQGVSPRGETSGRPAWPCLVLRSPKGWTGPKALHGLALEGTFPSHQVPLTNPRGTRGAGCPSRAGCGLAGRGALRRRRHAGHRPRPTDTRRDQAHERLLLTPTAVPCSATSSCPTVESHAIDVPAPGAATSEPAWRRGAYLRDVSG